jgi:hypothetical protein
MDSNRISPTGERAVGKVLIAIVAALAIAALAIFIYVSAH